jgi:predicted Zn-dependent peptidase
MTAIGPARTPPPACRAAACALALALGAATPAGAAAPEGTASAGSFQVGEPRRSVMKNGLAVMVLSRPGLPLVQMQMQFPSGAVADPPGKEGLADLTGSLLARGTRRRDADAFAEQVEFLGGTLGADARLERNTVAGEFAARDFEVGLGLMAEMVREPAFPQVEFDRERGLALARLEALADDPPALAAAAFARWLWGAHPYGRPRVGTTASLGTLTRADVVAFHRERYVPGGAILIVSGDVTPARARAAVDKAFGSWRGAAPKATAIAAAPPVPGRRVLLVDKPDATQSQILLGNLAMRRADPQFEALSVANTVLGSGFTSWLVDEVRVKRGLTYSIRSEAGAGRAAGSVYVTTFSKNETVVETIQLVIDLMRRMRSGGLESADLEKGRNYLAGLYPLSIEAPDALAGEILDVAFYGLGKGYIEGYQARIRAVTLEQARAAAARWVPADDLAVAVVGPAQSLEGPLAALGPVTVRPASWVTGADR